MSSLVAAAPTSSGSGSLLIFAPILLLFGWIFYTGRRRTKEAQRVQSALAVGDDVTTTSGLLGRIVALDDEVATLEVSPDVSIRFNRRAIAGPAPITPSSPTAASPYTSASSESENDTASDPTRPTD
jgi:preprotein translocase subunit YajC